MKVKSFVVGTINGIDSSMEWLDDQVMKLGTGLIIHSLTDTFCSTELVKHEPVSPGLPVIVRVIVYDDPS
jgi:hypothetical protein